VKLPDGAHTSRPWRIHEITPDFDLEDVWALPTPGEREDFGRLVDAISAYDPARSSVLPLRLLFAARWKIGGLLGWDSPRTGLGSRVTSLRERLPPDLRDAHAGPPVAAGAFEPLYLLEDEFAAEIANQTVHGVLHLGWVPEGKGRYRGQMAVLVKRNGLKGGAYMAAIRPFRYLVVYPLLLREIERTWKERSGDAPVGR
jgi:hypothetical protein